MLVTDVGDDVHVVAKFNMMVTDFAVFCHQHAACYMLYLIIPKNHHQQINSINNTLKLPPTSLIPFF